MRADTSSVQFEGLSIAPYDARAVANLILEYAEQQQVAVTQMMLLKLIYFSHGWFLACFGKPLVWNHFEAWKAGPVIKVVRDCFKHFKDGPIRSRAQIFDFRTGKYIDASAKISPNDATFIKRVFDEYKSHTAYELSELTHECGSPWDKIWNSGKPIGRFALRLNDADIRTHFQSAVGRFGAA